MGHRYTFYRYVDRSSRDDLYERYLVAVPEVLDIVSCCTKSGRGVSVDSDDREADNHVSR